MEKMNDYRLSPEAMVMIAGSSVGTQKKYYDKGYWYKQNNKGYEGTAEYLASKVLGCSNIEKYVDYERCTVNRIPGCRSKSFLGEAESYISIQRLYDAYRGGQLSEDIRLMDSIGDRIQYTVNFINDITGFDIREQLGKILTFDMLILNTDRHFNNIGIIANTADNHYKNAPVFDNGNSLLSNLEEFPFDEPIIHNIDHVVGQPFSASLERQAMELGFGLKINYVKLFDQLKKEPDSRALEVLCYQLERYKELLRDDTIIVHDKRVSVLDKLNQNKEALDKYTPEKKEPEHSRDEAR